MLAESDALHPRAVVFTVNESFLKLPATKQTEE